MEKVNRRKRFLFLDRIIRGFFDRDSRRGVSGIALLIFAAVFTVVSVSFVSLKFSEKNKSAAGEELLSRTSASVLKTFGSMFFNENPPAGGKPALEIALGENSKNQNVIPKKIADVPIPKSGEKNLPAPETQIENSAAPSSSPTVQAQKKISSCDFVKTGIPNHQIIFSEVNWAGSKDSANDEWIEIKNNSGKDIWLNGWQVLSDDENVKIVFEGGNKISIGAMYLLERTDDNSVPGVVADAIYSGALSNSGTILKIFDADCNLSDELDASQKWPAGDSASRKTMERSVLDLSWHTSTSPGGTPKKENSTALLTKDAERTFPQPSEMQSAPPADSPPENQTATSSPPDSQNQQPQTQTSSHILIAEVQITGGSGKTTNDFVRIFNPSSSTFNLKGYRLVKRTASSTVDALLKSWTVDTFITAGGHYTWANSSFTTLTPPPDIMMSGSIADNNSIAIRQGLNDTGTIIDAVAWGAGHLNPLVEGFAYTENPGANQILTRKSSAGIFQDTDNNQNDFEMK